MPASPSAERPARIVGGIVAFHPDPNALVALASQLAAEVARVVVFANSDLKKETADALARAGASLVCPGENVGLGRAYNEIAAIARREGAECMILFDQDSSPSASMVARLGARMDDIRRSGQRPALVGPQPVHPDGRPFKVAGRDAVAPPGAVAVDFAISSGSLVDLQALHAVGPFHEGFFIDAVDIEWCCRAWSAGYSVWLATDVRMMHQLGSGVIRLPLGIELTDQPPHRLYTYFRNQTAMLRLWHVPARLKLRFLFSLPLRSAVYAVRHRFARPVLGALGWGLFDGLMGRSGPPQRVWARLKGGGTAAVGASRNSREADDNAGSAAAVRERPEGAARPSDFPHDPHERP